MAVENLQEQIEKEQAQKRQMYPLMDVAKSHKEIREISEKTLEYMVKLYPDIDGLTVWEFVPRVTIETLLEYYKLIDSKKKQGQNVYISIGDFMTIGIEYGTLNAQKVGTFNPVITTGPELMYYNNPDDADKNKLSMSIPVLNDEDTRNMEFVCKNVANTIKRNYSLAVSDWRIIYQIFIAFLRVSRDYLIEHKDSEEEGYIGMDIYLGVVLDFGITLETDENGTTRYVIAYKPGQDFKFNHAKSDEGSEKEADEK